MSPYGRGIKRLGKKAGYVHDDRTIRFASLLSPDAPTPPKRWRIAEKNHDWPPYGNFKYGDCGFASQGHRIIAQEWTSGQHEKLGRPKEQQIVDAYFDCTGGVDSGIYLIDGLKYLRNKGIGLEADGTPHKIFAFAQVDHTNWEQMKLAAWLFEGLYLGLALPTSASDEIDHGLDWNSTSDDLYSWGGHAVWQIAYDERGRITMPTWTVEQRATARWRQRYVDEAWVVISEDQFNRLGRTPQGFDVRALETYMGRLG